MGFINTILTSTSTFYIVLRIVFVLIVTYFVVKLYKFTIKHSKKTERIHLKFLHNFVIALIYLIGIFISLQQIFNYNAAGFKTLLAGSGIIALTIGLAAQESIGNAINGMVISMSRPFDVGDRVHLINGKITGYIEDITLRHTVVRTFVNSRVIVPNSVINKELIENSNYYDGKASSFVDVTITYDSDLELARKIMVDAVTSHPDFVDVRPKAEQKGPAAKAFVRALTLYGVDLRVSMWTEHIGNNFDACSDARREIKQQFDKHGIRFALSSSCTSQNTP